jgi:hypothetical protein
MTLTRSPPKQNNDDKASENLNDFIRKAKHEIKLWSNLPGFDWGSTKWPTHNHPVRFCNIQGTYNSPHNAIKETEKMSIPFIEFAKAYLRYTQNQKETKVFRRAMTAMRLLEHSLIEDLGYADITRVETRHFTAASISIQTFDFSDTDGIGACLQKIAQDISSLNLSRAETCNWKHPYTGANSAYSKNKHLSEKKRREKLPDDEGLLALAEIFSNGYSSEQDDEDVFVSSTTCLLLSAPLRISELGRFTVTVFKEDSDKHGAKQHYLNYWSPKTGGYVTKEVPAVISDNTEEAIKRLKTITEEGRLLARHYETSDKFYRHSGCPMVGDDDLLTPSQVTEALGYGSTNAASSLIHGITGKYTLSGWTLSRLWKEVILVRHNFLNPHFPYQIPAAKDSGARIRMSDALVCLRYRQLSSHQRTSPVFLTPYTLGSYSLRVNGVVQERATKNVSMSIFLKHGYPNIKIRSHEMRHFLNTMAQEADIPLEAITRWSTRASNAQTRTYMHVSSERKAEKISDLKTKTATQTLPPVTETDYDLRDKGPLITTKYGICLHPWTVSPCTKHADCLNCNDLLICKGHKRSNEAIIQERNRVYENFLATEQRINNGEKVANRWYEAHKHNLKRLDLLVQTLYKNEIPNGTPVRILGSNFTHENRILDATNPVESASKHQLQVRTTANYHVDVLDCIKLLSED